MDINDTQRRLAARGFRLDDARPHECPDCHERSQLCYALPGGRLGGRDIRLCAACGKARSFRSAPGMEQRAEDLNFDIEAFLR